MISICASPTCSRGRTSSSTRCTLVSPVTQNGPDSTFHLEIIIPYIYFLLSPGPQLKTMQWLVWTHSCQWQDFNQCSTLRLLWQLYLHVHSTAFRMKRTAFQDALSHMTLYTILWAIFKPLPKIRDVLSTSAYKTLSYFKGFHYSYEFKNVKNTGCCQFTV